MNYVFDIDGTLTPSRLPIDSEFKAFFLNWIKNRKVYLVTGSDAEKTIEQVSKEIWENVTISYQCCGSVSYKKGQLNTQSNFQAPEGLENLLNDFTKDSLWKSKYKNHIEKRIGLINYSTIGRSCPQKAREEYYAWDLEFKEREKICKVIEQNYPELEATIGGEISIDIYPKGKNKAQVLDHIKGPIMFFGDKCEEGGNDYPLVKRLIDEKGTRLSQVFPVKDYKTTWDILKVIP